MVKNKLKKGVIVASLLFLAFGCSGSGTIKAAVKDEPTPMPVSQMEVAGAEETEAVDTDLPEGKYECKDLRGRVTKNTFYLFSDGSYERIDGQKGYYSHRPDPDSPETIMHITWTSGPNRKWDSSYYVTLLGRSSITLHSSDRSVSALGEDNCLLKD